MMIDTGIFDMPDGCIYDPPSQEFMDDRTDSKSNITPSYVHYASQEYYCYVTAQIGHIGIKSHGIALNSAFCFLVLLALKNGLLI